MQSMLKNNILDRLNRSFEYLRISVTDKCNFRCTYCMPEDKFGSGYKFLKKNDLLSYEEIIRLIKIFQNFGLKKVRLTGGEPLLRKNIDNLVRGIKSYTNINKISMTTNGSLLNESIASKLKESGLDSITISLDSLSKKTNSYLNTTKQDYTNVIDAIDLVIKIFGFVKINMVVIKNINDSDIIQMIDKFKNRNVQIRFIEYMDVGESNGWSIENVVTSDEIRNIISSKYKINKLSDEINSTSERWKINNHQAELAFISSISKPFCANCDRGRISADGKFFTCLFSTNGHDLLKIIRDNPSDEKVLEFFKDIWEKRNDHYSEIRFNQKHLKNKIEMSYIGG